jgi:hypothetical protein
MRQKLLDLEWDPNQPIDATTLARETKGGLLCLQRMVEELL